MIIGNIGLESGLSAGEIARPIANNFYDYSIGDDVILVVAGNDAVDGGSGVDTDVMADAGASGSFVDLNAGLAFSTTTGIDTISNIEKMAGVGSARAGELFGRCQRLFCRRRHGCD